MNFNKDELSAVAMTALEEFCFVFPEETDSSDDSVPVAAAVEIGFEGANTGALKLTFRGEILEELLETLLEDAAGEEAAQRDALGEIANVVCGHLLPVAFGKDEYAVGSPLVSLSSELPASAEGPESLFTSLEIDGGRIDLQLVVNSQG